MAHSRSCYVFHAFRSFVPLTRPASPRRTHVTQNWVLVPSLLAYCVRCALQTSALRPRRGTALDTNFFWMAYKRQPLNVNRMQTHTHTAHSHRAALSSIDVSVCVCLCMFIASSHCGDYICIHLFFCPVILLNAHCPRPLFDSNSVTISRHCDDVHSSAIGRVLRT